MGMYDRSDKFPASFLHKSVACHFAKYCATRLIMMRHQTMHKRVVGQGIKKAYLFLEKNKVLAALCAVYLHLTRLFSNQARLAR